MMHNGLLNELLVPVDPVPYAMPKVHSGLGDISAIVFKNCAPKVVPILTRKQKSSVKKKNHEQEFVCSVVRDFLKFH